MPLDIKTNAVITDNLLFNRQDVPGPFQNLWMNEFVGWKIRVVEEYDNGTALIIVPHGDFDCAATLVVPQHTYRCIATLKDFPVGTPVWVKGEVIQVTPGDYEDIRIGFGAEDFWFPFSSLEIKRAEEDESDLH